MQLSLKTALALAVEFEPTLIAAGDLAADMQPTIVSQGRHHLKSATGNLAVDIVSEADFLVQETVLSQLAKTPLVQLPLFAEEQTTSTSRFGRDGDYYLTLDPIDGTKRFTQDSSFFSLVFQLHDTRRPRYTFLYYPRLKWWLRFLEDEAVMAGPQPARPQLGDLDRTIVAASLRRESEAFPAAAQQLTEAGYELRLAKTLPVAVGSNFAYLFGDPAGYFSQSRNVYDGGVAYHSALVRGHRLIRHGFDRQSIVQTPHGLLYRGFLLALDPAHVPADRLSLAS